MHNRLDLSIGRDRTQWPAMAAALDAWLAHQSVDEATAMPVRFVVEELVINAINHGRLHPGQAASEAHIRLQAAVEGTDVVVKVSDNLQAFDPRQAPEPDLELALEDRVEGGLGVYLSPQMADHFDHAVVDGGNCCTFRKALVRAPGPPGPPEP